MTFSAGPIRLTGDIATEGLARRLAGLARPGDTFLLWGDIGAGKSTLARAFIRALTSPSEEVPSPTFTLVQTYATSKGEVWHADLYRLSGSDEVIELGLAEAFDTAICLVEWPDRMGPDLPRNALNLRLVAEDFSHALSFDGPGLWADRLENVLNAA
ncbi:MAG: tRNA threonylcarbamoyl adenosine modification protein YjeE [Rhodobacteraceae bacterium HLUCCA08]|nr:MAG: tRNA threonylcarbamoyl adenosine modification protein YjeE [Rhodobacteraceae bacterium HLUCCA08]